MFIELHPKTIASLQRSEIFPYLNNTSRSYGALPLFFAGFSYKHWAALRPASFSANSRDMTLLNFAGRT
jgi:hypothetical protein